VLGIGLDSSAKISSISKAKGFFEVFELFELVCESTKADAIDDLDISLRILQGKEFDDYHKFLENKIIELIRNEGNEKA
jgi:hypothetical protein